MKLDAQTLKRALWDAFKFSQDFIVQATPFGYNVSLAKRQASGSSGGGGSVASMLKINQTISCAEQTYSSGNQASAATALSLANAQKATVDASTTSAFATNFNASVFGEGNLFDDSMPITLAVSYKSVNLLLNGANYVATLRERRFENYLFLQRLSGTSRFTINYRVVRRVTIGSGAPTDTTIVGPTSYQAPVSPLVPSYGIQLSKAANYTDITGQSWPADPSTPTISGQTITNSVELLYNITSIT